MICRKWREENTHAITPVLQERALIMPVSAFSETETQYWVASLLHVYQKIFCHIVLTAGHGLIHSPADLSRGQAVTRLTNIIRVKYFIFKFGYAMHTAARGICINLDKTLNCQFRVSFTEQTAYCVWSRGHVLMLFRAQREEAVGNEIGRLPLSQIGRSIK